MEKRFFDLDANFICIGTNDIKMWANDNAKPFVILLNTEEDFDANGLDYEDYADMKVSETRNDGMYEGIIVIRIK
jgi:hypothetical protein